MSNEFYNPFHFVPVAQPALELLPREELKKTPPERATARHVTHDRYVLGDGKNGVFSGRIVCRLKLETPTVLGAVRTAGTDKKPADVEPYRVLAERAGKLACEPAIPETSLRGMVGSIFEAATNSTLRVLSDTPLSIRMGMSDALQSVGIVREDARGKRWLLPLAFPMLKQPNCEVPIDLRPFAGHMQVKFYLNGFSNHLSQTADTEGVYFIKATYSSLAGNSVRASDSAERDGWLLGRRNSAATASLITREQWLNKSETDRRGYIPGLLRNLGRHSSEALQGLRDRDANAERAQGKVLPKGVKHRWFIPLKPEIYDPLNNQWKDRPGQWLDIKAAACRFEGMAMTRTLEDARLPFEVRGSLRNQKLKQRADAGERRPRPADEHGIKIRPGDLLCFGKQHDAVSISCIWRKPAGSVGEWFSLVDPNLLPMNPRRENLTLAEQLFGFVEQAEKGKNQGSRIKALASRVRFSAGRLCSPDPGDGWFDPPRIAQILGAPKPPSPLLYFGRKNRQPIKKSDLTATASRDIRPLGRKWYLHHDHDLLDWTTVDEQQHLKQKAQLKPLKVGLEFVFDVAFDNLSRRELALLLYALRPTAAFRHRLGMGKPLGLGTVAVQPLGLLLVDRAKRYKDDDFFDRSRYAQVAWQDAAGLDLAHAADDVQRRYAEEQAAPARGNAPTCNDLIAEARALLQKHAPDALAVLDSLGDPATTAGTPVHYPRLPDALLPAFTSPDGSSRKNTEAKLFQWHAWNEPRPAPQFQQPLDAAHPRPQPLSKESPFVFFLYDSLPSDQRAELQRLLTEHFPGCFHTSPDPVEIRKVKTAGEIPVHLGVRDVRDVDKNDSVRGFGPLPVEDRNGLSVVDRFSNIYLAPLRNHDES